MIGHCCASRARRLYAPLIVVLMLALMLASCTRPRPRFLQPAEPTPTPPSPTTVPGGEELLSESALVIGDKPDVVPGQVVIKLERQPAFRALSAAPEDDGIIATGVDNIDRLNRQFGVKSFEPLIKQVADASGETISSMASRQPAISGLYVAAFEAETDPATVAAAYSAEPGVIYAEPNYYAYASDSVEAPLAFTPNDPYFSRQWNMTAVQAPQAWDTSGGQGVIVAVVDSGIAYEDFENYRRAPDLETTSFMPGYDFINNDPHPNDDFGHGTHVAGTIAQSTNNALGVAGVAWGATLMPVKVLDARGQGGFDVLAQGIMFAADRGARVINLSLSGRRTSQLMEDAVRYAVSKGALIVAATGNSAGPVQYPAAYPEVLAVGSVEFQMQRAGYSDFGPEVDVVAPGGDTSVDRNGDGQPDGILQETFRGGDPSKFALYYLEGTSMAAPHVSGVAALLFAFSPSATAAQVRQAIETSALDLGPAGHDNDFGYGLVQAANALAVIGAQPPITPTPSSIVPTPSETPAPPTSTPTPEPSTPTLTPPITEEPTPTPATPLPTTEEPTPTLVTPPPTTEAPMPTPVTPPPTTTTTPVVAGTEDLVVNGGFESDGGWSFGQTQMPGAYTTEMARTGLRSARIGIVSGYDVYSYSSVFQTIHVPEGVRRATLTYWTYPISADVYPNDLQMVLLLDEAFHVVGFADQSLSNARQWIPGSYDLTPFAGRTVTVYFGVYNGGSTGLTSAIYVDDVAVTVER